MRLRSVGLSVLAICLEAHNVASAADGRVAQCPDLRTEIDRLNAEINSRCTALSSVSDEGIAVVASIDAASTQNLEQAAPRLASPTRRGEYDSVRYAKQCWAAGSTFADPSCNCLGLHPKSKSQQTIKAVVGNWCVWEWSWSRTKRHRGPILGVGE
jgi:hypothetical protein